MFSSDDGLVSLGEYPSFGQPERARTALTSHSCCGHRLGEVALVVACGLSCVGVGAAAPDRGCASRRRPRDTWWEDAS
jgi:hypothetical protein